MSAVSLITTVTGVVLAADPSVKPGSPPPITFVVTALFAAAVILLGLDLVRRVRRAQFKAEIQENLSAEIAERDAAAQAGSGAAPVGSDPASADDPASDAAQDPAPGAGPSGDGDPSAGSDDRR